MTVKGFNDWIEVFSGGVQRDSNGRLHDGDALIDKAVAGFDAAYHEPPHVLGHPSDDSPSWGWVSAVKAGERDGLKTLLVKSRQVVPEFEEGVKSGQYKKRSAAFYPDGRLRHVGWLGAMPPAVKGLADVQFDDGNDEAIVFEFAEIRPWTWGAIARTFRRLREYFIEKEGAERADQLIPEWNIEDVSDEQRRASESKSTVEEDNPMKFSEALEFFKFWKQLEKNPDACLPGAAADGAQFTEADLTAAKEKAAKEAEDKATVKFAEAERKKAKKQRDSDIAAWLEEKVTAGLIPPAVKDGGLLAFMQGLDDRAIEFAEGQAKQTPLQWFQDFLDGVLGEGKSTLFSEIATKSAAADKATDAEAQLGEEIAATVNPA
jgi:hypothetical protein